MNGLHFLDLIVNKTYSMGQLEADVYREILTRALHYLCMIFILTIYLLPLIIFYLPVNKKQLQY